MVQAKIHANGEKHSTFKLQDHLAGDPLGITCTEVTFYVHVLAQSKFRPVTLLVQSFTLYSHPLSQVPSTYL